MTTLEQTLGAAFRCAQTGGLLQCGGHVDYWSDHLIMTWHHLPSLVVYRVVPYDHPAPEIIERRKHQR